MTALFVDTDVLVRLLTGDDLEKQARAVALFERVEKKELAVVVPITVIADTVDVLASPRLYHLPRTEVVGLLTLLVRLPNFKVRQRRMVQRALDIYLFSHLDFGDALIAASMEQSRSRVLYSFEADLDRIQGITRLEP